MFRSTLLKSLRAPLASAIVRPTLVARINPTLITKQQPINFIRSYSGHAPLGREEATERIIELLEGYDKVDISKGITEQSSFVQDLGLDSLDVVEVVMELEHEFSIEIPDNEADSIKTVGQAIDYIMAQPDAV